MASVGSLMFKTTNYKTKTKAKTCDSRSRPILTLLLTCMASVSSIVFKTKSYRRKAKAKTLGLEAKTKADLQDQVQELRFCRATRLLCNRRKKKTPYEIQR